MIIGCRAFESLPDIIQRKAAEMYRYNLSKRLLKVANLVEEAVFLVDIGCDHGFLAIDLIKSGRVQKAMCTDINEGPLSRAAGHIKEYGLEERIETCLSDGLLSVKDFEKYDFDACTICGMGGLMGVKIIHEADRYFRRMKYFYLQLQSDIELVRIYLKNTGYQILFEDMVFEDGKFYTVMKVKNYGAFDKTKSITANAENNLQIDASETSGAVQKSLNDIDFDDVPKALRDIYDNADYKECFEYKYPYYEGMDEKVYEDFLKFLINKYETIKSYLSDNSDRLPVIEKELKIMNYSYELYKKEKKC